MTTTTLADSKLHACWHSPHLERDMTVVRWGHWGAPVLLFPTAGGDAHECERFRLLAALAPLIEAGRIKLYSCDSAAGQVWLDPDASGATRARTQDLFDAFVYRELVPAIRHDCRTPDIGIITAGASFGAFNALASLCRHPDAFTLAICMSGTFDFTRRMNGERSHHLTVSSPLEFLPLLAEGPRLEALRRRFVVLATGEGPWETPSYSWQAAHALGDRGVPNRVDLWGAHYDHDWPTWREMLPRYLDHHA